MAEDAAPRLFVSHHSSKYAVAQQVEALLAKRGIRCWIAPRDVPPGAPFDSAIQEAINDCAAVLLLFCSNSDKSRHVKRELILGDSAGRPIIPLRLEAIDPGELAYHLADSQWIDWIDRREAVMDRVAAQVRLYAGAPAELADDVATLADDLGESSAASAPEPKWAIPALVGALVLALGLAGYFAMQGGGEPAETPEAVASIEETADEATASGDTATEPGEDTEPSPTPSPAPTSLPPSRATDFVAPATPAPRPTATATLAPSQIVIAPATAAPLQRVVLACRGAATDTEYLLCANPDLDAKARELGTVYRAIRDNYEASGGDARGFQSAQRSWLNDVKATCSSKACVEARYNDRIAELRRLRATLSD